MNLTKAFDTINNDLLIVNLLAYGFEKNALDLVYSYLKNRKQRVKIDTTFTNLRLILLVVYHRDQY